MAGYVPLCCPGSNPGVRSCYLGLKFPSSYNRVSLLKYHIRPNSQGTNVLNITAQRNTEGAKSYFAQADYYSEGQEINGEWGGKGAILLGLFGEVDKRAVRRPVRQPEPADGKAADAGDAGRPPRRLRTSPGRPPSPCRSSTR